MLQVYLFAQFFMRGQLVYRYAKVLRHLFYHGIAFGVDGCVVERVPAVADAQESGALLESLVTHARHFHQFATAAEGSVFGTVVHDVLCQSRA